MFLQVGKREILENGGHDDARSHIMQYKDAFSMCTDRGARDSRRRWEIAKSGQAAEPVAMNEHGGMGCSRGGTA